MKYTLIFAILFAFIIECNAQKHAAYQVECISVENDGSVSIRIWNEKLGKKYTNKQARKDALDAILFSGVPGNNGCVTQKPILTTQEAIDNFRKIEKDFYSKNGKWSIYTREATAEAAMPEYIGDKKWKVYQVSISKDLVRKYLEEQKIIKSLNSGF